MTKHKVFVFGNPDLEMDSLPLRMLPKLRQIFSEVEFIVQDPNEELIWGDNEMGDLVVLDTALGTTEVTVFNDLEKFISPPRVSMHDFDVFTNLRLLKKLGKIKSIKIITIPANKKTLSELTDSVIAEIRRALIASS